MANQNDRNNNGWLRTSLIKGGSQFNRRVDEHADLPEPRILRPR